tara:strand:- start:256 stop:489 length:234 start_codon:yes stop_codon:yes gene_type:complete
MERAREYLTQANVKTHNQPVVTIWVTGEDPDSICVKAQDKICNDIIRENKSGKTQEIIRDISDGMRVVTIRAGKKSR